MNVLSREDIAELSAQEGSPCISLFLARGQPGQEATAARIELKNRLSEAQDKLMAQGMRRPDAQQLLAPADEIRFEDLFWRKAGEGVALYCRPGYFRAISVPLPLEPRLYIGDRFYLRPLLPLLEMGGRFYILALTHASARLYEASQHALGEIELPEIPHPEVDDGPRPLQLHSHRPAGKGPTAEAIFHGQALGDEARKTDLLHFFGRVNEAVCGKLSDQDAPLILACVGYLAAIYESVNTYRRFVKVKVPGNPQLWSADELRQRAWHLIEPELSQDKERALSQLRGAQAAGRASDDVREVVLAARDGRVETLFVAAGRQEWGKLDSPLRAVVPASRNDADADELVDLAAIHTLRNGGTVYTRHNVSTDDPPMAAMFRY